MEDQNESITVTRVPDPPRRSGLPAWVLIVVLGVLMLIVVLVILVVTLGGEDDVADEAPTLDDAENCAPDEESGSDAVQFDQSGDSLTVRLTDPKSIEGQLGAIAAINCVVDRLDGPSSITERVSTTSALAGPQSESWDNFEANWSYHPEGGLVFTLDER